MLSVRLAVCGAVSIAVLLGSSALGVGEPVAPRGSATIAFVRDNEVWYMNRNGTGQRRLTNESAALPAAQKRVCSIFKLSDDRVLYARPGTVANTKTYKIVHPTTLGKVNLTAYVGPAQTLAMRKNGSQLVLIRPDGWVRAGTPTNAPLIAKLVAGTYTGLSWSPQGRYAVYIHKTSNGGYLSAPDQVELLDTALRRALHLTSNLPGQDMGGSAVIHAVNFCTDGIHFGYVQGRRMDSRWLFIGRRDGGLTWGTRRYTVDLADGPFQFSPWTSAPVAYSRGDLYRSSAQTERQIYSRNFHSSSSAPILALCPRDGENFNPVYSPDGAQVAYEHWTVDYGTGVAGPKSIWVVNAGGTTRTKLADNASMPAW